MTARILIGMLMVTSPLLAQNPLDLVRQIMDNQERCWNSGDLECFMQDYWRSDSLMFVSATQVYYGYHETLARYRNSYPDRTVMGQLNFELITLEQLSESAIFVVGKYHLEREIGNKSGHFTLLWRKIDGKWQIVVDHSS